MLVCCCAIQNNEVTGDLFPSFLSDPNFFSLPFFLTSMQFPPDGPQIFLLVDPLTYAQSTVRGYSGFQGMAVVFYTFKLRWRN